MSDLYIPRIGLPFLLPDTGNTYINCSQIQECGNWETEHNNSVLEITRPRGSVAVRIRIRIRWIQIFLGLLDLDQDALVKGMDPDPYIIKQTVRDFFLFLSLKMM